MLISFTGLPSSGKTTLAAKLFAFLKETGLTSELIVEQARFFIAKKRHAEKLNYNDPLILTDEDQKQIYNRQRMVEKIFSQNNSPKTYIVSDSSIINPLIYCTQDLLPDFQDSVLANLKMYDLVFYCHPFEDSPYNSDPNRVHSGDQILALRQRADYVLKFLKENLPKNGSTILHEITGTTSLDFRSKEVQLVATESYLRFCNQIPLEDL